VTNFLSLFGNVGVALAALPLTHKSLSIFGDVGGPIATLPLKCVFFKKKNILRGGPLAALPDKFMIYFGSFEVHLFLVSLD